MGVFVPAVQVLAEESEIGYISRPQELVSVSVPLDSSHPLSSRLQYLVSRSFCVCALVVRYREGRFGMCFDGPFCVFDLRLVFLLGPGCLAT